MREMKDSGVEWIGEIPKDWDIIKCKYLLRIQSGDSIANDDISNDAKYPVFGGGECMGYTDLFNVSDANILVGRVGARCGCITNLKSKAWATDNSLIISCIDNIGNKDYLSYLLDALDLHTLNTSNAQPLITSNKIKNCYIVFTYENDQQTRIVNYLDSKCSQIDSIIEKQQIIIEKLKEYKLSVITETITKGINPDVEMKYSGSVWFGDIPKNWEMKRLKYVFHIQKDIVGEEGHTVLSITQRGIVPKDFSNNDGQFANSYANYQLVHVGNFAMNHMDLLTGWVDISKYEGVTSPDYRVFVLDDTEKNYSEYYLYLMQMCYSARIFYGLGQGVSGMGRWRLQADKFLNFRIPVPPFSEQKAIAEYVDTKIVEIERSIEKRTKLIEKLQEYKKSLIYEVVTGKKEV